MRLQKEIQLRERRDDPALWCKLCS
jgi:hypothetical protein